MNSHNQKTSRLFETLQPFHQTAFMLLLALAALAFVGDRAALAQAQAGKDVRKLSLGKSSERKISAGDLHEYKFDLRRGQVIFVELDEQTYDVKLELVRTADSQIAASTNLGGGLDRENLIFAAETNGGYLLRISAAENEFGDGSYRFSARLAPGLNQEDKLRIEALKLMSDAVTLQKENTVVKIREAISKREEALTLWQKLGDRYWEGRVLDRLGTAHHSLQQNNKAIDYLNRALAIVRESGDKLLEALTLNTIGSTTSGFGEYRQAIEIHNQALPIFRKAKNSVGIMNTLNNLGAAYAGLKDYAKANECYQQSLAEAQLHHDKNSTATDLYLVGTVQEAQNEKAKALETFNQSLVLWREIKNKPSMAWALFKIGSLQSQQGETNKALESLTAALTLFQEAKNRIGETNTYGVLYRVYDRLGKDEEGMDALKKNLAYAQEFKLTSLEIGLTGLIAGVYSNHGNYEAAIKYAEMSLAAETPVIERAPQANQKQMAEAAKESKASAMMTLASIYFNSGDTEKALRYFTDALKIFESQNEPYSKSYTMLTLSNISEVHVYNYEWNKALETSKRALALAQALDNKSFIVKTTNSIGLIYDSMGDRKKALESYLEALEAARSIKEKTVQERRVEAAITGNIGSKYLALGKPQTALEYHNRELALQQEIKDPRLIDGQASAYQNLARVYLFLGETGKALELYDKSLDLFRQAPPFIRNLARNRDVEAIILNSLGGVYRERGDLKKASELYAQTLKIALETNRPGLEANTRNNISIVNLTVGEPQKALNNLLRALELNRKIHNKIAEPTVLNNISRVYSYWSNKPEALKYLDQALKSAEEIGNRELVATCLLNTGLLHLELSENDKALDEFNRSLQISQEIGNPSGAAIALSNLAFLYSGTGERGKALANYEKALAILREISDRTNEAVVLGNIAFDYSELGEYQKALENREQALRINRDIGDKIGEVSQLLGLGTIYQKRGREEKNADHFKKAVSNYEQALRISRESESRLGEAAASLGLGQTYVLLNDSAKATTALTAALDFSRKYQSKVTEDLTHVALGELREHGGNFEQAVEEYQQGLTLARSIGDKDVEAKALRGLMSAWKARRNPSVAIVYGKQAVNKYQELRGSIRNLKRETQDVFRDKVTSIYRDLANLLVSERRLPEAEQVLALLKDAEFKQLRETRDVPSGDTLPYNKTEKEVMLKVEELAALRLKEKALRSLSTNPTQEQALELEQTREALKSANGEFLIVLRRLGEESLSVGVRAGVIKDQQGLQSALSDWNGKQKTGVVALYTVIGVEREKGAGTGGTKFGWVILVTADDRKAYPIDVNGLAETVAQFRRALSDDKYDPQLLGEKLYNAIFRQTSAKQKTTLEADLQKLLGRYPEKTLMWSLDGILRYIPMAALHDGKTYLVEKYRNVMFTNQGWGSLKDPNQAHWQVLGLGVSQGRENFQALPGVERELADIVRQPNERTGILAGARRLNQDFIKKSIFDLRESDYQVVHIATHYHYYPTDPTASFLVLGNGKLTFADMEGENNLFGKLDLLTLSACDTAMGGANGEEAEGFPVLAQRLGAKSVIASLWKVSDEGTPELMVRFYKLRTEDPSMSKGKAFGLAQLSLLGEAKGQPPGTRTRSGELSGDAGEIRLPLFVKDPKQPFAHPHYWASFILIGNWL